MCKTILVSKSKTFVCTLICVGLCHTAISNVRKNYFLYLVLPSVRCAFHLEQGSLDLRVCTRHRNPGE